MPEDRVDRRLAAILAADIGGYSRLMGTDEEGTLRQLKAHRKEIVDPKITEHRGRIVKTTGDGMLVEFVSVVDAVRCAVDIQRAMSNAIGIRRDLRIEFRIGINVGDIIFDGDDIFGDGVNVAARLEALADAGGIMVSSVCTIKCATSSALASKSRRADRQKHCAPGRRSPYPFGRTSYCRQVDCGRRQGRAHGFRSSVYRRASVRQYERRCRARVFRRWDHRRHHYSPVEAALAVRYRAQFIVRL